MKVKDIGIKKDLGEVCMQGWHVLWLKVCHTRQAQPDRLILASASRVRTLPSRVGGCWHCCDLREIDVPSVG